MKKRNLVKRLHLAYILFLFFCALFLLLCILCLPFTGVEKIATPPLLLTIVLTIIFYLGARLR